MAHMQKAALSAPVDEQIATRPPLAGHHLKRPERLKMLASGEHRPVLLLLAGL
jgi:hypothetical protein